MPYENAESFNQTLTKVLNGEHADAINQFCQSFIATFNTDVEAAKLIGTGKLEMSSSKKEEAAQMTATVTLDVASIFQVPTGLLGDVVKKSISALFKGVRKKGYKKVAGIKAQMTHMELISEALALGLIVHYKKELLDVDTQSAPKKGGKHAAKRLLRSLKSKRENSLMLKEQDTLLQQLKSLFEWCVKKDYISWEPEFKQEEPQVFSDDDYSTLLLFASAELLGLPRDHFVEAQQNKAKALELNNKIDQLVEKSNTEDKPAVISVDGIKTGGHLAVDAAGNNAPRINANNADVGGHAALFSTGEGADPEAARIKAKALDKLLSQPAPASQATALPASFPAKTSEDGQRLGGKAKQSRLVTMNDIKRKKEKDEVQEELGSQKKKHQHRPLTKIQRRF